MATDNSNAVENGGDTQSPGDYDASMEKLAELTLDPDVQDALTLSVDGTTQLSAQAKLEKAGRLLSDGWMGGSLGIDDLAAQIEAGSLTKSAALQKYSGTAFSLGISAYNIAMAPEGQKLDQSNKEAASQMISIASGAMASALMVAGGIYGTPAIVGGLAVSSVISGIIQSRWGEAVESGLESVGDWLVDQKDSIVTSVEERIGELNRYLNDKLVEWNPLGIMTDDDDLPTFDQAERMGSPIVIDLDGDGLETLSREDGVHFDHDGNGLAEKSGWVAADDGLLVRDLNDNGQIDGGQELFGDQTLLSDGSRAANGFEALAELDSNGDGRIDAEEADQQGILIWRDTNGDGKAQADELLSFSEAGLASVAVGYSEVTEADGQGNDIRQRGEAQTESGETRDAADIWFSVDPQDTQALDDLPLSDSVAVLPDVPAFGNVLDLQQAMILNAKLESLVQHFVDADSDAARQALLEPLIYQWTGAADTDPNSRDEYGSVYMDARKVVALEALVGRGYDSGQGGNYVQGPQAASILEAQFARFESFVKGQLLMRSEFQEVFDTLTTTIKFDNDSLHLALDTDAFIATLREKVDAGHEEEVVNILKALRGADNYSTQLQDVSEVLSSDEILASWMRIRAASTGSDGEDFLEGTRGNDFVDGQKGDDRLQGGAGDDIYRYDLGDGSDIIYDTGGQDTLAFGAGITPDDLIVTRDATTLFLTLPDGAGGTATLRLDRVFDFDGNLRDTAVERFTFADSSTLTVEQLIERIDQAATEEGDQLYGFSGDDTFDGLEGDDRIAGGSGNDTLKGGDGDDVLQGAADNDDIRGGNGADVLQGGDGADHLEGGVGDDTLEGGKGSDTYRFAAGWGSDVIRDVGHYRDYQADTDVIAFGEGISPSEIAISRSGDDLILMRAGSDDRIQVDNYFQNDGNGRYAVETVRFADGTEWSVADVKAQVLLHTDGDDDLTGYASDDEIIGGSGDDIIRGRAGDDTLRGDEGNDTLYGEEGSDTYRFEQGWGSDRIRDDAGYYRDYQADTDVIAFGEGIAPSEIALSRSGDDLILTRNGSDDRIQVDGYFQNDGNGRYAVETVRFADGTEWSVADVKAQMLIPTDGADDLMGYASDDDIRGGGGDDTIRGGEGDDTLRGDEGNDTLYGEKGSDTYRFEQGWGSDRIRDVGSYWHYQADTDVIAFGEGILPSEIALSRSGGDLILTRNGSDDRIQVDDYFQNDGDSPFAVETIRFADGTEWSVADVKAQVLTPTDGDDYLIGYASDDELHGGNGADRLEGGAGDDTLLGDDGADRLEGNEGDDLLQGGIGDDRLYGGNGADVLVGSAGNDTLYGGEGSDTYRFERGWGSDRITDSGDYYDYQSAADVIAFGEDILPSEIAVSRSGSDLILTRNGSDDRIQVDDYFHDDGNSRYALETIRFADGTEWSVADVKAQVLTPTDGDDYLIGYASDDELHGGRGADRLEGGGGNDTLRGDEGADRLEGNEGDDLLQGGIGDDRLYGGNGADVLVGSAGNDTLYGGEGSDTYRFDKGWGSDVIRDIGHYRDYQADTDVIAFGVDILPSEVAISRSGDDLILARNGSDDRIQVDNYFQNDGNSRYGVETIRFAEGTEWSVADVKAQVLTPTDGDDYLIGYASDDELQGGSGADRLEGRAGNDTLRGDEGADRLEGNEGDDLLQGGIGDDRLYGGNGADVLVGAAGNDILYGGRGSDTYRFEHGWGADRIEDSGDLEGYHADTDVIAFGEGISPSEIVLSRSDDSNSLDSNRENLILTRTGSNDRIQVNGYFQNDGNNRFAVETIRFADGTEWSVADVKSKLLTSSDGGDELIGYSSDDEIDGGAGDDALQGREGDDTLRGDDGADRLEGGSGNDSLLGGSGNDELYGGKGDDLLEGGTGNDILNGKEGSDTYSFDRGWGTDRIQDEGHYSDYRDSTDVIAFGEGIAPSEIAVSRRGNNLILELTGTDDRIEVVEYFHNDGDSPYAVETIRFSDGTEWSVADVLRTVTQGTSGDDRLFGGYEDDHLSGLEGDDVIHGGDGNDYLEGNEGNDRLDGGLGIDQLDGGQGDDTLTGRGALIGGLGNDHLTATEYGPWNQGKGSLIVGGRGNDVLQGSFADDTYLFAKGDGHDILTETRRDEAYSNVMPSTDTLKFSSGVRAEDLSFFRQDDHLLIVNGDDSIQIRYWFVESTDHFKINRFQFEDSGEEWSVADVEKLVVTLGNEEADELVGYREQSDEIKAGGGDDKVWGREGDDTLDGEAGNDYLRGGSGDDTILGGDGDDQLQGDAGNDHLKGGGGDDVYVYAPGDGHELIDNAGGGTDWLIFNGGIGEERLSFSRDDDDLLIAIDDGSEGTVRVSGHFLGSESAIDWVQGDGGYGIPASRINREVAAAASRNEAWSPGGQPDETGGDSNETSDPTEDDAALDDVDGNELTGNSASDIIVGGNRDDWLDGRGGNDRLSGGNGNDVYRFSGGVAHIRDTSGVDRVIVDSRITFNDVASGLQRSGNDLHLRVSESADRITVEDFFADGNAVIETIEFEAGGQLTATQIFDAFGVSAPEAKPALRHLVADDPAGSVLNGSDENELIQGGNGNDTLAGHLGDDVLEGGRGDDRYVFTTGDGQDVINNQGGGFDTLWFEDIGFQQVANNLMRTNDDLKLSPSDGDSVLIKEFFLGGDQAIDSIAFSEGGSISKAQIFNAFGVTNPDPVGSPDYTGLPDSTSLDREVAGSAHSETIITSSGRELIDAGAGDDVLRGNGGDDYLIGGDGADQYVFGVGDGHDTINNFSRDEQPDTLYFEGIDFEALLFSRDGDDLSIAMNGRDDQVTVDNWYVDETYRLASIETDEGDVLEGDSLLPLETLESGAGVLGVNAENELTLV
ncbi:Ca2+-binding protein, RTX toxin-related [Onishia taeanensis]|uniref:Ca2+-binding protein, RTX toxin-related n=1 Tax=Onishia taeanensis TaxID=284577 RepID=A0A1G7U985_9GAMM|nr:calcium-binding protein [Halomonas taeanensis]SDG43841.1 Ca2+-binding protein, RTX toxin-related [Halomonas taeanensis]